MPLDLRSTPTRRRLLVAAMLTVAQVGTPSVVLGHARAVVASAPADPSDATRAGRSRIVVLAPQLEGDVSGAASRTIAEALHDGLRRGAVEVVDSTIEAARCVDAGCRRDAASTSAADALVSIHVVGQRRDYDVAITLVDGDTGGEIARVERRCELCGIAELAEHIDGQAAALLARLQSKDAAPATLVVRSTPSGALVRLDEVPVGETPIERHVGLGAHVLHLQLRGYVDEQRRFEALAGVRETIAVELVPVPDGRRRKRMRAGGIASLAIGIAATTAGITLLGLHGRSNVSACAGDNIDVDGDCKYLYDTRLPGAVVTAVGLAGIITGITLVTLAVRKRKARSP